MSIHHENMAWEIELPYGPKIVLLAIARLANLNTSECSPTIQYLAFRCGISESAARAFVVVIERAGYITRFRAPGCRGATFRVELSARAPA